MIEPTHDTSPPDRAATGDSPAAPPSPATGAAQPSPQSKRSSKKPQPITSLEQFIEHAYSKKGKRLSLRKQDAIAIADAPPPPDTFPDRLRTLAREDRLLGVPKEMLLAALPRRTNAKAFRRVLESVYSTLKEHPASADVLSEYGESQITADNLPTLLLRAGAMDLKSIDVHEGRKPLTSAQVLTLRNNLLMTFALWASSAFGISQQVLIRELFECVWKREASREASSTQSWRRLVDAKNPVAAGVIASAFVLDADEQRRLAQDALRREERATSRAEQLDKEIAALNERLVATRRTIEQLEQEVDATRASAEARESHLRDEFERLRTRVLRRLTRELELLDEGLLALRRDPPKVRVMEDHADRATGGLREEIKALASETIS